MFFWTLALPSIPLTMTFSFEDYLSDMVSEARPSTGSDLIYRIALNSVSIGKAVSSPHHLRYGVPQGSVAGAPGFTYYSAPLSDIINLHGLNHTIYADDTQVYILFDPCHRDAQIDLPEGCIKDIHQSMGCSEQNEVQ